MRALRVLIVLVVALAVPASARAATLTFVPASGDWNVAANWDDLSTPGADGVVPGPGDTAVIAGSKNVTVGATPPTPGSVSILPGLNATVRLDVAAGQSLTAAGSMTLSGDGNVQFFGPGSIGFAPGATLSITLGPPGSPGQFFQLQLHRGMTLTLPTGPGAATTWSAGNLVLEGAFGATSLVVPAGATFPLLDDGTILASTVNDRVVNRGTVLKSGPGDTFVGGLVETSGLLDVRAGTLNGPVAGAAANITQTGGEIVVAGGAFLRANLTMNGGTLRGRGDVLNLSNTGGTVAPGGPGERGALGVRGSYTQAAGGTLEVDVNGAVLGSGGPTGYDRLAVAGAADLGGTLAIVNHAGFTPQASDTFTILTRASGSGSFATLTGATIPAGSYQAATTPTQVDLTFTPSPADVVIDALTSQGFLDSLTDIPGSLLMVNIDGRDLLVIPNLATVGLDVTVTDNDQLLVLDLGALSSAGRNIEITGNLAMTRLDLGALGTVGGNLNIAGNPALNAVLISGVTGVTGDLSVIGTAATTIDLGSLTSAGSVNVNDNTSATGIDLGALTNTGGAVNVNGNTAATGVNLGALTDTGGSVDVNGNTAATGVDLSALTNAGGSVSVSANGAATGVDLGALTTVGGDLNVESSGSGAFAPGPASPGGNTSLDLSGYTSVAGTTAAGSTTVQNARPEASVRLQIPGAAFVTPVGFTVTRLDPVALAPEDGTAAGGAAAVVDPVAAYTFDFGVPTLDRDATLTFEVSVDGLDAATRQAFLAALAAGTATLATKGDGPAAGYQAFALCTGAQAPSADGCVRVEPLDANGNPTTGTPALVRFTGIVGHFSTWAVAIVTPRETLRVSVQQAEIEFKKKRASDSAELRGTFAPVGGSAVRCGEDVAFSLDGAVFSRVVPGARFKRERNGGCTFRRTRGRPAGLETLTLDFRRRTWRAEVEGVDLDALTNPVEVGLSIGDDHGSQSLQMRERPHRWTFKPR